MSTSYDQLGLLSAWRRFSLDTTQSGFERQLREIESGAPSLNLSRGAIHLAAEIGAFETDLADQQRIALILMIVVSLAAREEGSTRFPVTGPQSVDPMRRLLGPLCGEAFGVDGIERMRIAIERMLAEGTAGGVIGTSPDDYKPLLYLAPFIYHQRILSNEISLARKLAGLIERQPAKAGKVSPRDALRELTTRATTFSGKRFDLSDEQCAAIECAATAPLTIISGGPGTGKTSIVLAILKVLMAAGLGPADIALAAPTGKAAYRIGESIRESFPADTASWNVYPQPTTIHRLLGYSPTRRDFYYHRSNPLRARVVVVDEGSMLDLELTARLLDALPPDARLVILGDADQLPSVSAGAVFRDLLPKPDEPASALSRSCVRLTHSYRVDREAEWGDAIFKLARAINATDKDFFSPNRGDGEATLTWRDSPGQIRFLGAEWLEEAAVSGAFLERWYAKQVRENGDTSDWSNCIFTATDEGFAPTECDSVRRAFENAARSRILCVTRVLECGSERINMLLHRRLAHETGTSPDRDQFMVGEPVMVLRNDYQRMLFNGDQGVVLRVRRPNSEAVRMAVFPRGDNFVAFPIDALKADLELCYAMTVHKAQGSEFDAVAVIMPAEDIPILSREILYTAVSRARKSVIIVGSGDVIRAGLGRGIERYSGLREHLDKFLHQAKRA
jgi:exodeoxyribonuclease V alpha subunit